MSDDSTIDPEDVNLEDTLETILELARNVTMYGPAAAALIQNPVQFFETAIPQIFSGAFADFAALAASSDQIVQQLRSLNLGDLANNIDPGFGFNAASGQPDMQNSQMLSYGDTSPSPTGDDVYTTLDSIVTGALSQDWRTRNAKPGNPLILEAYALSGRNYEQDGFSNEYNWNAAFVNWVLSQAGLSYPRSMSPQAYNGYGNSVDFGTFRNVRKNDIIVFRSASNIGSVGFVRGFDSQTNKIKVLGGNFSGTVKEIQIPFSRTDPVLRVTHVRRSWAIPSDLDVPLIENRRPSRPGQQTSGPQPLPSTGGPARYTPETPSERADRESGGSAASGGILL